MSNKLWRYQIEDENFAAGCFGQILLAKDSSNKEVVIKKIPKEGSNPEEVRKEIVAGKALSHVHLSKFIEHFENNEYNFLVFERIHAKDLYSTIEKKMFVPYPDADARNMFKQILKAVRYCHKKGVVHRDIKLENVLMDPTGKVTLIDFGLCDIIQRPGQESERFCGSMDYVAPEVLSKKSYDGTLADSFSLGVVLYTLLFAEFPFVANDRVSALRTGRQQPAPNFVDAKMKRHKVDPLARDLIMRMLQPNPVDRATLNEVKMHPWLRKSGLIR